MTERQEWPNYPDYFSISTVENFFFLPAFGVEFFLNRDILLRIFSTKIKCLPEQFKGIKNSFWLTVSEV